MPLGFLVVDGIDGDFLPGRDIADVGAKQSVIHETHLPAENLMTGIRDGQLPWYGAMRTTTIS
jgi:hypothetical protein